MDIRPPPPPPSSLPPPSSALSSALPPLPPSTTAPAAPDAAAPGPVAHPPTANGAPTLPNLPDRQLELERELPTVVQDLVPLSYVIDRVVASAYSDLANLVETLPSQPDQSRKRAIVDYVLHNRRQLVKLLVLTRWSTEAERVGKAMNIIGFLSSQNHLLTSTITSLTETSSLLPGARVRNYDLPTSLSVLTHGNYDALPSVVREEFANQEKLGKEEVVQVMREVEEVIRWRLVMGREWVPRGMKLVPWRIADGRVTFTVPGLWEASFTYSGDGSSEDEDDDPEKGKAAGKEKEAAPSVPTPPAEWFLLSLRFLFRVKDARGVPYSPTPSGPLKGHLIELCNRELLRRPYLPPPFQPALPSSETAAAQPPPPVAGGEGKKEKEKTPAVGGDGQKEAEEQQEKENEEETDEQRRGKYDAERAEIVRKRRRDRPLGRAYTFLQRLALSYQLESVAAQAAKLAATGWSGSLRVERRRAKIDAGADKSGKAEKGKGKEKEVEKEKQEEGGEEVRVEYWSHKLDPAPSSKPPPASPAPRLTPGGTLVFSLRPPAPLPLPAPSSSSAARPPPLPTSSRSAAARQAALQAALARGSFSALPPPPSPSAAEPAANGLPTASTSTTPAPRASATPAPRTTATPAPSGNATPSFDAAEPDSAEPDVPPSLLVTWLPPPPSQSTSYLYPSTPTTLSFPSSSPQDAEGAMDVEKVLRRVTRVHARDTVRRLAEEVRKLASAGGRGEEGARLVWPRRRGREGAEEEDAEEEEEDNEEDEDEKEDGEEVRVPYLLFPLYPSASHAVGAFIDPLTGRFELRAVPPPPSSSSTLPATVSSPPSTAATLEPSSARDQRLRVASDRIDRERFNPPLPPPGSSLSPAQEADRSLTWMRSVIDVIGRIRASTILDDLETLALLLSLPAPTRRLPIPPRELGRFGTAFATVQGVQGGRNGLLFVPLQHQYQHQQGQAQGGEGSAGGAKGMGLEGFWLVLVLVADGTEAGAGAGSGSVLRPALVRTREVGDGASNWLEVAEVGWISLPSSPTSSSPSTSSASVSDTTSTSTATSTSFLPPSPSPQTLLSLWRYAVHRASLYKTEEALRARRIPFRVVLPPHPTPSSSPMSPAATKPYLVVPAAALVRTPAAQPGKKAPGGGDAAWPNVAVQCVVDEEGGVRTTLHARFRFPPSSSAASETTDDGRPDPSALPPNVLYNPKQDVVVFVAEGDLEGQVDKLLRAYATVARTVLLAQQNAPSPSPSALPPSAALPSSASETTGTAPLSTSKTAAPTPSPAPVKSALKIVNGVGVKPFG